LSFDFLTIFIAGGYAIAWATGVLNGASFELNGWRALGLIALVIGYFALGKHIFHGTIWKRILGVPQ
jgi:hypothetical protein